MEPIISKNGKVKFYETGGTKNTEPVNETSAEKLLEEKIDRLKYQKLLADIESREAETEASFKVQKGVRAEKLKSVLKTCLSGMPSVERINVYIMNVLLYT